MTHIQSSQFDKFKRVLREVFMLDHAELDFGIYRIMNQKRVEIDTYLNESLAKQMSEVLTANAGSRRTELQTNLDNAIKNAKELGIDPEQSPKVKELKAQMEEIGTMDDLENSVYNHLAIFFSRYYDGGDFISQRRYKKNVYAIPYEGEEVKLHWANADQYYIKTGEYFKNYSFRLSNGKRVEFTLKEVTTEQNNNKATDKMERRFALFEELPIEEIEDTLHINFTYELLPKATKQKKLMEDAFDRIKPLLIDNFKEYAEVFDYSKIAEKSGVITDYWTNNLLDLILRKGNLNNAYKQVKKNKGKGGIDGMQVDELLPFLRENQDSLIQEIREGKYKPNPVRRVEIPKETKGEFRKLGVPTVVDRVIQQAIAQELSLIYEEQFSENSFGFRPKRGAHDALRQCQKNVNDGYVYVVDMDLEKFFDTVCQNKLIEVLSRTIKDGRVISLIHKYLNAGVIAKGMFERTEVGMPQGGPLSPLLSNVMLNELDKELENRGHRFVRYADDCMIFCKSRKSAERTLKNIIPFIEKKLFLKVNRKKTEVAHISTVKYLGYSFYRHKGKCRFRVHPKSVAKMKNRIRELTDRNKGISNEVREKKYQEYVRGWVEYFRLADMKKLLQKTDEWARRRIRAIYWKQWKKIKTKCRMLKALGLEDWKAKELANSRKGYWRMAKVLNQIFSNKIIAKLGYTSMLDYYLVVYEN